MRQYLSAQIQAASEIELNEIVEPSVIRNIKAREPHPEIRLYSIGHDGQANLHLPGIGNKTITWIQAAVRAIADKLAIGTAVFDRHDPNTNSHVGRIQIGEVVGKAVRQIGDKLNTLAAIYVYPQFKSRPLDVASVEAEIEFSHDGRQAWPTEVRNVSGIALSNSGIDTPGFPGATLMGAVQAFYVQAFGGEIGAKQMNLSDVQQAVKDLGLVPSQVFDVDTIMGDAKVVVEAKKAHKDTLNANERLIRERDTARERIAGLENTNAEKDKQLQQHTVQSKSANLFDTVLADPERKLDDRAKTFIKRTVKDFTTTADNEDSLKADVGKFVDAAVKEYGEQAKLFGVEVGEGKPLVFKLSPDLTVDGQKVPAANTQLSTPPATRTETLQAEMNPDENPLIPGGKAAEEALKT